MLALYVVLAKRHHCVVSRLRQKDFVIPIIVHVDDERASIGVRRALVRSGGSHKKETVFLGSCDDRKRSLGEISSKQEAWRAREDSESPRSSLAAR